jgi:hypothetical protein
MLYTKTFDERLNVLNSNKQKNVLANKKCKENKHYEKQWVVNQRTQDDKWYSRGKQSDISSSDSVHYK